MAGRLHGLSRSPVRRSHRSGLVQRLVSPGPRRGTLILGAAALTGVAAVVAVETGRLWRRTAPPVRTPAEGVQAGRAVAREAIAVVREGYRDTSTRENALVNMLAAFLVTFGLARTVTYMIRTGRRIGPLRNVVIGDRHIHHFVPGIAISLLSGAASIALRREQFDKWLAVPFGAGAALILDEAALLLELEDVYWSEEGVLSVQVALAALALLALAALAHHLLERGEHVVLAEHGAGTRAGAIAGQDARAQPASRA